MKKLLFFLIPVVFILACQEQEQQKQVLIFSKTASFRHSCIDQGIQAIQQLGADNGFETITTEDATYFTKDKLQHFQTVIFFNTTGNVLNDVQQKEFEQYIQNGGGFVGIHAAADTEYDWQWYNQLVGAYFDSHPQIQTAKLLVNDKNHRATQMLPSIWERSDEWYNYKSIQEHINVLIQIDENSYSGGTNGEQHPMAWYHDFEGGRAFYTGLGHTEASYNEPLFLEHLLGGINYALGN